MARTKKEYTSPKSMTVEQGDGIETSTVQRYLERAKRDKDKNILTGKDEKGNDYPIDRPVTFKVPTIQEGKRAAAGVKAFQKAINDAGGDANNVLARIINNALIEETFSAHKEADENGKTLPSDFVLFLNPGKVRVTDENEATANMVLDKLKKGELSNADIQAMLASLSYKK